MAIIENGYLGGFAGTLGPAIGYYSRGKWCVRSKPGQVRNPRTQAQTEHRELFKQLVCFASTLTDILYVGLRHEAALRNLSVYNLFVYDNKQAFSMVDGEVQVDYPQLVFSHGPVAPVGFGAPQTDAFLNVTVPFEKNPQHKSAKNYDTVYLVAYNPVRQQAMLSDPTARRSQQVKITLPGAWQDEEVHLYGFSHDAEGRSSECSYLGIVPAAGSSAVPAEPETAPVEAAAPAPKPAATPAQKVDNQYTISFFAEEETGSGGSPG